MSDLRERIARALDMPDSPAGPKMLRKMADAVLAELGPELNERFGKSEQLAPPPQPQASAEDVALVDQCVLAGEHYDGNLHEAWQRIRASLGVSNG